jgi:predicted DsbA family dithiol-disulfide isomerase
MSSPLTIDFISDVVCPWCFIGLVRLEQSLDASAEKESVKLDFHPFQLDPSIPPEGVDLRERLAAKYGLDPKTMFTRVEAAARESGIPLDFTKVQRFPNTLKAHALVAMAKASDKQHAIAKALFEAYFLEGKDIGDSATLVSIATKHGLDADATLAGLDSPDAIEAIRQETRELSAQGIRGVPFVIFGQKTAVSGAQPVEIFREAIERARA